MLKLKFYFFSLDSLDRKSGNTKGYKGRKLHGERGNLKFILFDVLSYWAMKDGNVYMYVAGQNEIQVRMILT